MKTRSSTIAITVGLSVALSACIGGSPQRRGPPVEVINRVLATAPGEAQPSTIVATEIAFSRAAREQGQWTAFRQFAAPGAMIHGSEGPFLAEPWLARQSDPKAAVQWVPRTVVISCTGALAVSQGRLVTPEGLVGTFITVWQRQSDNTYRWTYDVGAPDNPQPPQRERSEEGEIIVTAIDAVQGLIADCPTPQGRAARPASTPMEGAKTAEQISGDGSLVWSWEHRPDGTRYVAVDYYYDGEWVTKVLEERLASSPEG